MLSDGSMGRIFVRTSLYLRQSARLGLAKLTGKGESRDNIVYESMVRKGVLVKDCPVFDCAYE